MTNVVRAQVDGATIYGQHRQGHKKATSSTRAQGGSATADRMLPHSKALDPILSASDRLTKRCVARVCNGET